MKIEPKKYLKYLKTKEQLERLTDKQLEDIGLPRYDIERKAFKETYSE